MEISDFWRSICKSTPYDSGLAGLRNTLFTCRGIPWYNSVWLQVKSLALLAGSLFNGPVKSGRTFCYDGEPVLVYIPFLTPSNWGNLKPVVDQMVGNKDKFSLLLGHNIEIEDYPEIKKYKSDLVIRNTSLWERSLFLISSFALSLKVAFSGKGSFRIFLLSNPGVIWNNLFRLKIYERGLEQFFSKVPEKMLSTSEYFPVDFAVFDTLNRKGSATFLLQHGIIGISHYPFIAGRMITWGPSFSEQMIRAGSEPERILCGGMPNSDIYYFNNFDYVSQKEKSRVKILLLSETQAKFIYPGIFNEYRVF